MDNKERQIEKIKKYLLPISTSGNWSDAKKEWRLHSQHEVIDVMFRGGDRYNENVLGKAEESGYTINMTDSTNCLCGQYIHYCSIVFNESTKQLAVIGNNCATNAIGIKTSTERLGELQRKRSKRLREERELIEEQEEELVEVELSEWDIILESRNTNLSKW